jgi:exodeoxyribonuclease VII large subunit
MEEGRIEIYTPTSLTAAIESSFKQNFKRIYVEGEITGRFRQDSGHVYFYLNDARSKVKAIVWKGNPSKAGSIAENGLKVIARGYLTTYYARSEYQLIVETMEPKGEGALRLAFEKMKARLQAEGIFNPERKRKLPFWPKRVALLTSAKGAAVEDFIKTAIKRCPQAAITLYPVKVQGEGAALEMAEAVKNINEWGGFDLIVMTRGGGSLEDLWAFNEEVLVRAVSTSRTLTFAAIGHATDLSLVEMAADGSAITPTSAAETVFPDTKRLQEDIEQTTARLVKSVHEKVKGLDRENSELLLRILTSLKLRLHHEGVAVANFAELLMRSVKVAIERARGQLEGLHEKLFWLSPNRQLQRQREEYLSIASKLLKMKGKILLPYRQELNHAADRLQLVSPLGVLTRGYSIALKPDGGVIRSASALSPGESFFVRFSQGQVKARAEEITAAPPPLEKP